MAEWKPRPHRWEGGDWLWPVVRGVPVPLKGKAVSAKVPQNGRAIKATMARLEVGDAMFVQGYPNGTSTALAPDQRVRQYARDFGYRITCRTVGRGVVMVWRVA